MSEDLNKLYGLLTHRERKLGAAVVVAMVVAAGLQALAAGSLYPFLSAVSDSAALESGWLGRIYEIFGFRSERTFFLFASLVVLSLIIVSNAALAFSHWARLQFQWGVNHTLSVRLLKAYLGREYAFFLKENTAELHKNILREATEITDGLLKPVLTMLSSGALAVAMIALMLAVDPTATLIVMGVTGGGYGLAYYLIRGRLQTLGSQYAVANRERYKSTAEAFGGIKEVKVLGHESHYLTAFEPASHTFTSALATRKVYARLPKYVIEALAMGSLLAVLAVLLLTGRPVSLIVPIMGTFAFAGYRMMPAFRDILSAMASFRFTEEIFETIEQVLDYSRASLNLSKNADDAEPLPYRTEISLEDVTYRYPGAHRAALHEVSLVVRKNWAVALVGRTGAGKTTIVDVLLGLLKPTQGRLLVDDKEITAENVRQWQANLGYVPQEIYLADTSVRQNIAYGVPSEEVEEEYLVRAARTAHVHEFVRQQLPDGYDTVIGERGIRLSGGQRQRIGIARALYRNPPVLVLDEATSEIDRVTEANITRAIRELSGEKTLIVVAHRLRTIEHCDRIYVVHGGGVVERGTYETLMTRGGRFKELIGDRELRIGA